MVMTEKKKVGFILPQEMIDLVDELAEPLGRKERWVALSAAILAISSMPEAERYYLFRQVRSADGPGGSFANLIALAKSGEVWKEAERHGLHGLRPDLLPRANHGPADAAEYLGKNGKRKK